MGEGDDEPTCGKGVAANAALPDHLTAVLRGLANVLENHIRSLDPAEANGRAESEAYQRVIAGHRDIGDRLAALAALMRSYRDLPMASHDMDVLMDKASFAAFRSMVESERSLLAVLQDRVREHGEMLAAMGET